MCLGTSGGIKRELNAAFKQSLDYVINCYSQNVNAEGLKTDIRRRHPKAARTESTTPMMEEPEDNFRDPHTATRYEIHVS